MGTATSKNLALYEALKNSINTSDEIVIASSYIRESGIKLLINELKYAKTQGKSIKILTENYKQLTEPNALYRLLEVGGVKILNKNDEKYHTKPYIFRSKVNYEVFDGSSVISSSILSKKLNLEQYFCGKENEEIRQILNNFYELYENNSFLLSLEWLRKYEKSYKKTNLDGVIEDYSINSDTIEPIKFQIPALYELSHTREEGYKKAMVIVGTGLGKTYLSVFDSMNFKKVLFIAHRDEILKGAKKSYESVYKETKTYGFFNGNVKEKGKDIIFASVFTLSKDEYLNENWFPKDYFDYIVVDEFHHSSSNSYLKILEYFQPKFLLGLTATPDRADNGDVYKLCDYNIAYECDFRTGINNGWLVPFEYYGIYDDTDYSTIPWRSGKYDTTLLENALIIEKRVKLIFDSYMEHKKQHTIGFCASVKHCEIMNEYFRKNGIKSEIIIGKTPISQRQEIMENFKNAKVDIIFTVDIFNEGVDIPCIDMLLFLRPTQSYTIFIQQLGRGLRTFQGKRKLKILDFVGNYKGAELKPSFLMGNHKKEKKIIHCDDENFILPYECTANFSLEVKNYFNSIIRKNLKIEELLKEDYDTVKEKLNRIPSLMDMYTFGKFPIKLYRKTFKSWYSFQEKLGVLNENQKKYSDIAIKFLDFLESTSMTKSYKMSVFSCIFGDFSQTKNITELTGYFKNFYLDELHKKDLGDKKHQNLSRWNDKQFEKLIVNNPIKFLTNNGKNREFFSYNDDKFIIEKTLFEEISQNPTLLFEIRERIEYRTVDYFHRKYLEV